MTAPSEARWAARTALLVVRAEVPDATDRALFDAWYHNEHLPEACRTLRLQHAWRAWSKTEPSIHYACYEFPTVDAAEQALASKAVKLLIHEFDRVWGPRVTRAREVVEVVHRFAAST